MALILYRCSSETSVALKDEDFDTPLQLEHNSFIAHKSSALHNAAHISL
jgi:hypothetical protein